MVTGISSFPAIATLYDSRGVSIMEKEIDSKEAATISLNGIKSGLYFLVVELPFGENRQRLKILKSE